MENSSGGYELDLCCKFQERPDLIEIGKGLAVNNLRRFHEQKNT